MMEERHPSAADFGIDLSLIEENLRLTPEQRIDQNQAALILAKRAMGRPKDLHAVLELEVIRELRQKT